MNSNEIANFYRSYLACVNQQDWHNLHRFVAEDVRHNERQIGLSGYHAMLVEDFRAIPDLSFNIKSLVCEPPMIASRLWFDCTPAGTLFDLPVNGKNVQFSENVFYEIEKGKIWNVWSVIDKAAIAAQI